jgi:uncharacterized repeat protein (TIGR03806 family)
MSDALARVGAFWLCLAALTLGACARAPASVHFFAEGRPVKLSDWRVVYADAGSLSLNSGVVPYDLNTPLFSDYAHKLRTVWMPPGMAAKYDASDSFDFPVGTIISKTFYYPLAKGGGRNSSSVARNNEQIRLPLALNQVRLVETRLLVRRESGWQAFPYVWNAAQTDADLARTGDAKALELISEDGGKEPFTYVVPNENQCAGCHVTDLKAKQIAPIGLKARHLNRDYAYPELSENQLRHWEGLGYLVGAPLASQIPKNANWQSADEPVDRRARAYLDINCGHCHNPKGAANTTALDLSIFATGDRYLGVCKPPVAAGRGTGDHFFDVVPGKPDDSILSYRMQSNESGVMMPEQGRTTTHREGVALIRQWIIEMRGGCEPETQNGA